MGRSQWSDVEITALRTGVRKHGEGSWAHILGDPMLKGKLKKRDNVSLKDKWRQMSSKSAPDESLAIARKQKTLEKAPETASSGKRKRQGVQPKVAKVAKKTQKKPIRAQSASAPGRGVTVLEQFDLTGRVAIITGGTGYLGSHFAAALAEHGCSVVIAGRDAKRARAAAAKLPIVGDTKHYGVELDYTSGKSVVAGFSAAVKTAGQVDIVINNGLDLTHFKDLSVTTFDDFAKFQMNTAGYTTKFTCFPVLHNPNPESGLNADPLKVL